MQRPLIEKYDESLGAVLTRAEMESLKSSIMPRMYKMSLARVIAT